MTERKRLGGSRWRRTVARVVRRDGGICHLCGGTGADSADHVIPRSLGGSDRLENLKAVHHNVPPKCNRFRGTRPLDDWFDEQDAHDTSDFPW